MIRKKPKNRKKQTREKRRKNYFRNCLKARGKMLEIWYEYEKRETPEAVFVYALDKLQPFLQRLISGDNGWKEKSVDLDKLKSVKPQEIKSEPFLSEIWDNLTREAQKRDMLYKH